MRIQPRISICFFAIILASSPGFADQLIQNGGFETGTLAGWTVTNQAGGSGSWFAASGTTAPLSGEHTAGPASGSNYALSDQTGPGAHSLIQSFTLTGGSAVLSFDMFVNDWDGGPYCGNGLSYTSGTAECGRVDILTPTASAFDTGAGVVENLYKGADSPLGTSHGYTLYTFDLSGLAPGTYQLRFAEADNQNFFNMGVDNVSLVTTPEPTSLLLVGTGLLSAVGVARRKLVRTRPAGTSEVI
jgi:hypothetical protein